LGDRLLRLVYVDEAGIGNLLLLLNDKYDGDIAAVSGFRKLCESNGIAHRFMTWT